MPYINEAIFALYEGIATKEDIDIVSFGIHYNGGTNTTATNYKTFVTKNGDFRLGW